MDVYAAETIPMGVRIDRHQGPNAYFWRVTSRTTGNIITTLWSPEDVRAFIGPRADRRR